MAETVQLPVMDNGFGGAGWAAGLGGFVGSMFGNGGWGGWGGNRAGQVGADVAISNSIEHVSDQVTQGTVSQLQSAQGITNAVNGNTVSNLQSQNVLQGQLCNGFSNISREIDATGDQTSAAINQMNIQNMQNSQSMSDRLCAINNNITAQNAENRLQAAELSSQSRLQTAQLQAQIAQEACATRELNREIATQALRDELTKTQAALAAKTSESYLDSKMSQWAMYVINQLKPAATTAAAG